MLGIHAQRLFPAAVVLTVVGWFLLPPADVSLPNVLHCVPLVVGAGLPIAAVAMLRRLPDDNDRAGARLVRVRSYPGRSEAEWVKQLLIAEGINATTSVDDAAGMEPHLSLTRGGVRVYVLEPDAQRADELLRVMEEADSTPAAPSGFARN